MFKQLTISGFVALLVMFVAAPAPVFAQGSAGPSSVDGQSGSSRKQAIFDMAYTTLLQEGVPGYAIAIIKDGSVVFRSTFGMANIEQHRKVTKDTVFGLASLTKTFTGLALLHLVDEGKLKPGDTLDKFLKDLPPSWQKLTIFQLASMRAGMPESRADELPWPEEMSYLEKQPLEYKPDTQCLYSNPGFRVLGSVIEAVTGMSYMDYITRTILEPLGMSSTGTTESMAAKVSCQYLGGQGPEAKLIHPIDPITAFSAGMLASSLDDMCTYAQALLDQKILSKAAYQTYLVDRPALASGKPARWAWGWGATVNTQLNQRVNSMNGGLPGVASTVILVPASNAAVVALSNMRKKPVYAIAKRALNIYLTGDDLAQDNADSSQEGDTRPNQEAPGRDNSNSSGGP
jgi:CubicO group peptidase (beta-lactamase class C family)